MIRWLSLIKKLERKKRLARCWRSNPNDPNSPTVSEEEDLGWAVLLEGSTEWLFIGKEEPPAGFKVGNKVEVTIRPV